MLQENKLLKGNGTCPNCHVLRRLTVNKTYKGGYGARCPKCRKFTNLTDGTFFSNRISFKLIFAYLYLWCGGVSQIEAGDLLGMTSGHTKVDWFIFFRDFCFHQLENTPGLFAFGGPNSVVQVDESVVTKRKFQRGRVVPEQWVVGIYDTLLRRGVVEFVEYLNGDTLIPLIRKHVAPGTHVFTDGWAAYNGSSRAGYIHSTVNHLQNFVDPETGTCVNAVEAYWSRMKTWMRRHGIMASQLIRSHVTEFMWRDVYANGTIQETFKNFISHLKRMYPIP